MAYALKISFNSSGKICMLRNNNLINSAYSLKKRTYKDVFSESVKSINVYSLNNFDSTHLAGVSLNSYFRTKGNKRIENKMLVENYVNDLEVKQAGITYYLFAKPTLDSMHSFVVELVNNENEIFRDTTTTINLTK